MKTTRYVPILVVLVSLGCASSSTGLKAPPTVDVTGRWNGYWTATFGGGTAAATLAQSGASVTGDLRLFGTPDNNPGGPIEGTIEGNELIFVWVNRNGSARGEFTVTGEQMSGETRLLARIRWNLTREK